MAKRTYSVRKGFEYQDLYCAIQILTLLQRGELDALFQIESDELHHADDLVLKPHSEPPSGHQVKFHVTKGYVDTFDSLIHKPKEGSRSLLEKLYRAWNEWSNHGEKECSIVFVSSNGPEPGGNTLGAAVLSETERFTDDFATAARFSTPRNAWASHLGISLEDLLTFLSHVQWRFSYRSILELKDNLSRLLAALRFPHNQEAIAVFLEVIGHCALQIRGDLTLRHFLKELWERPIFHEAVERLLPEGDLPLHVSSRATEITVALVSLDTLPAFTCSHFAPIEEAVAIQDYKRGLTVPKWTGLFEANRGEWLSQYIAWHGQRVLAVLKNLERFTPDLVVFPRFSIPFELTPEIVEWSTRQHVSVALGGHSLPSSLASIEAYQEAVSARCDITATPSDYRDLVADTVLRAGRLGRFSLSRIESPYRKEEDFLSSLATFDILCQDGWVSLALLPSSRSVEMFGDGTHAAPELIICPCGIHADLLLERLQRLEALRGVPVVLCPPRAVPPRIEILRDQDSTSPVGSGWEGVRICKIRYDRATRVKWSASISDVATVPIIYGEPADDMTEMLASATGMAASLAQSQAAAKGSNPVVQCPIVLSKPDPETFFLKRALEAEKVVRAIIGQLEPDNISDLSESLAHLVARRRELEQTTTVSQAVSTTFGTTLPLHRRPSLIDRSQLRREVSSFMDGGMHKRVIFLYGPTGIGKRSIVADVRRTHPHRDRWLRFRCIENGTFAENLAQLLVLLGCPMEQLPTLEISLYHRLCTELARSQFSHVVIEDAHHLPIKAHQQHHAEFLGFLSALCTTKEKVPRLLFVSGKKGDLEFAGKHQLEVIEVEGLELDDTIQLLQELLTIRPPTYPFPAVEDLDRIAKRIHGHPLLAEVVASIIEDTPVDEVLERLHQHEKVRHFVVHQLLGQARVSPEQEKFLLLASIYRIPVPVAAFSSAVGAQSRAISEELYSRFLLQQQDGLFQLHPLLADHFRGQIETSKQEVALHSAAFQFFDRESWNRQLTLEEQVERVYHAIRSNSSLTFRDLHLFAGPLRSALFAALENHDWDGVESAATHILDVFPSDSLARVAMAVSLDARGKHNEADPYCDSIGGLEREHAWVAIELVRSKIRRHDFDHAEFLLNEMREKFDTLLSVEVARAQLLDVRGMYQEAIEKCEEILSHRDCSQQNAFAVGLILRDLNHLEKLIEYVDKRCDGKPHHTLLRRLYCYACVVTDFDPKVGLSALADMWHSDPNDGFVAAEYALALTHMKRTVDAEHVLTKAMERGRGGARKGRFALLEAAARYWEDRQHYRKAHQYHRDLLKMRPFEPHVYRRFAKSLIDAASAARASTDYGTEQACLAEAERILKTLLEIVHQDRWAADQLQRVQMKDV